MAADSRLHRFNDNVALSPEAYAQASALLADVQAIREAAPDYVAQHGLDPEVFLPGNIWAGISANAAATTWSYDLVNHIRAASPFTGFEMMMWGRQDNGDVDAGRYAAFYADFFSGRIPPPDLDARLDRDFDLEGQMLRSRDQLLADYDDLTTGVTDRFLLPSPPAGGEIGLRHRGHVVNPDLLTYQSRFNAILGAGVLDEAARKLDAGEPAHFLEIGPGVCVFAWGVRACLGAGLQVHLIDLPSSMLNGIAFLSCVAGPDAIGLVTPETRERIDKPFVFIPNHLVPAYERFMPPFDLTHNAISFNEMHVKQVRFYLDFVARHMAQAGCLHICGAHRVTDYHVDVFAEAARCLPAPRVYQEATVGGLAVREWPHTFYEAAGRAAS